MSGVDAYGSAHVRSSAGPIPAAMVLATVFAGGVVIFWGWVAFTLIVFMHAVDGPMLLWTLGSSFAAVAGIVGMIGCLRRWRWVRWAALAQAVLVGAGVGFAALRWPSLGAIIVLLLLYAGVQFLPSSHRWYHPIPR